MGRLNMDYKFVGELINDGTRNFILIPFNVWEKCNIKGNVKTKVKVDEIEFECKLTPKGNGNYYVPITKSTLKKINDCEKHKVSFKIIDTLTRINSNSPYNIENPIRKIDNIESIIQPKGSSCGEACVAMLTGIGIEKVKEVMHCQGRKVSLSMMLEALDYFGIRYKEKMVYTRGKRVELPICCIINEKAENGSHFLLQYKNKYYDSVLGVSEEYDMNKIIGFLEIIT
jgi:hypothetical protein